MGRTYLYCDYPANDAGEKCFKPARLMPHDGLRRCESHAARLPYWPTDSTPKANPVMQSIKQAQQEPV